MKTLIKNLLLSLLPLTLLAAEPSPPSVGDGIVFRELRYDGKVSDDEARFAVNISADSASKSEVSAMLFDGELALLPPKLPGGLRIERNGNVYTLFASKPGKFSFDVTVIAKITRAEPWNHVSFKGPIAAIASVTAQAVGSGVDLQLLTGTVVESVQTNNVSRMKGFLGAEPTLSLRWQSRAAEISRKPVVAAETIAAAQITPTVIKFNTQFYYEVIQGKLPKLTISLPLTHALTRLVGEQIRDWSLTTDGERQTLTVEFIKAIEKSYQLTLLSEQTVEASGATVSLVPPQPADAERESGTFNISADDMQAEIDSASGLRQINAPSGSLAAYRFSARPLSLALKLKRIEPVLTAGDRVSARLEETRLLVSHALALNVEKAGIYSLDLTPQPGFVVAEVRGDGVEDWKFSDGKLRVSFTNRLLGPRMLNVQLEQALKKFSEQFVVEPLRVTGAGKETAQIGAASAPGIRLKTAELVGLREIPANRLPSRADELLGYTADTGEWKLSLSAERLAARIVADIFNLVTIGDGLVGGSATIRYGLVNQGVQEFRVTVPAHLKNVEFTGPNIRRKEIANTDTNSVVWTIGLQDKAWGGYTLVVTYDYQFDPQGETLPVAGIHAMDAERETGSVAITTAANLKLTAQSISEPLRRVDEAELSAIDRALITRSILLAYQYTGEKYDLAVDVKRYAESSVLSAVADRTQITSVLTEAGELLTQASFMVKNNDKQFQKFLLPTGANFWSCYVNGRPAKPERDADWLLVPLPRGANRDEAFAVDIVYAEKTSDLKSSWSQALQLRAPRTDVPNTYAEWELFVPTTKRLSGFGGSMNVAQGTTYGAFDAWKKFLAFYADVLREAGPSLLGLALLAFVVIALVVSAVRRGWNGFLTVLVVLGILAVLAGMMLPALSRAKSKAVRIAGISNLKQIGLAAQTFASDNGGRLPNSFSEMMNELQTDKVTIDPATQQPFVYLGNGLQLDALQSDSVLAYSPMIEGRCSVLFADGHVEQMTAARFGEISSRGLVRLLTPEQLAAKAQTDAVMQHQFAETPPPSSGMTVNSANSTAAATPPDRLARQPAAPQIARGAGVPSSFGGAMVTNSSAAAPAMTVATSGAVPTQPAVAGIRSLRIEVPRTGTSFLFTKILNVRDEPLSVSAKIMSLKGFQTRQMMAQVAAFVAGLGLFLWQWRSRRNSFVLTVALVLIFGSVSSLLIAWRALHDALILGFPIIVLAILCWLIWKLWPRTRRETPPVIGSEPEIPPAVAALVIFAFVSLNAEAKSINPAMAQTEIANRQSPIANVSILSATYIGSVNERVAQLDATIRVAAAKDGQKIPLFGEDVAVQSFSAKPSDVKIVRDGKNVSVALPRKGDATLQFKLLVRLGGDVAKRQLAFAIPAALTSRLALTIDQPEADVEFPGAISFKRSSEAQRTKIDAMMGAGERVELFWTPRVKRAAEIAATVMCQNSALISFGGGVFSARSVLEYQVTQGELRQARVRLPAGHRLLRVEGEGIRTWSTKEENGEQILLVDLIKGVTPSYRLTVETERTLEALPATVKIETPHAMDVKRETGSVALRADDELELSVARSDELQRVDPASFAATFGDKEAQGVSSAFRFLKPEFSLETRVAALQPQIEAVARNHIRVGDEQISVSTLVDYTIKRAGVFALKLSVPENSRIEQVAGANVLQWTERKDGTMRIVDVTLKERTVGSYSLRLELVRNLKESAKTLAIAGVHPLGAEKLSGYVSVFAEPGVAVKTSSFDGLTEIPATAIPTGNGFAVEGGALAFKFISAEAGAAPAWKLTVATETVEPWVRAEVASTITVSDTIVSGHSLVRYDIQNAPVKEFRLKIPAALKNVEITGANIRRRDQNGENWRVELQNKVRGAYTLTVTWEQARTVGTNLLELAGLTVLGVERETGALGIVTKAPLQVTESRAADLLKVDANEWPEWAGRPDANVALAYRYLRPGYKLAVEAKRFAEAEVLQALAENFNLTTVVAEDGQMMTELSVSVRNNGRQHLEIALPAGATVWSAFVAGQALRPSLRDGKLLLPMENADSDDAPVAIQVTYVATNHFPQRRGQVNFVSPTLDVPLKNAHWELYLPPDFRYDKFAGTMSREVAAAPVASSFSLLEYSRKESEAKTEWQLGLKSEITSAKRKLAEGNVKEASDYFNRARNKFKGTTLDDETKQVEGELRRAQASNLVQAQKDFSFMNAGPADAVQQVAQGQPMISGYDAEAAGRQWEKLQQAQELAVANIRPLRVNLPTRGMRHAFGQVLQTEVGKPMTVSFAVASAKVVSWPKRVTGVVVGFIGLWALVAFIAGRNGRRQAA